MIDVGKLRERVTIQQAAANVNSLGEAVLAWADVRTVWASVDGVGAREALEAGQQDTTISHRVRMRYVPELTQQMRFLWRSRILNIVSLLEYGNRSEHVAICEEQLA